MQGTGIRDEPRSQVGRKTRKLQYRIGHSKVQKMQESGVGRRGEGEVLKGAKRMLDPSQGRSQVLGRREVTLNRRHE